MLVFLGQIQFLLLKLQTVDEDILDETTKTEIEAQARFLRAFFYFQLVHTYGGAMIHDEVAQSLEELSKELSSTADVNATNYYSRFGICNEQLRHWESGVPRQVEPLGALPLHF